MVMYVYECGLKVPPSPGKQPYSDEILFPLVSFNPDNISPSEYCIHIAVCITPGSHSHTLMHTHEGIISRACKPWTCPSQFWYWLWVTFESQILDGGGGIWVSVNASRGSCSGMMFFASSGLPLRGGATLWAGNANPGQCFFPVKPVYFISMKHLLYNHLAQLVLVVAYMTHKGTIYIDNLAM